MQRITDNLATEALDANIAKNAAELQLQNELIKIDHRPLRQGTGPEPEIVNETSEQKTLRILVSALTQDKKNL